MGDARFSRAVAGRRNERRRDRIDGVLTALTWLMMSTIGSVHPAIRRGELDDPGFMMLNLGRMTPLGSLMGHLAYGLVLGIAYDAWPLS
jgi:hypothetical protein